MGSDASSGVGEGIDGWEDYVGFGESIGCEEIDLGFMSKETI